MFWRLYFLDYIFTDANMVVPKTKERALYSNSFVLCFFVGGGGS